MLHATIFCISLGYIEYRPGLSRICEFCLIQQSGYSVSFTSLRKYIEHVLSNHEGYSVYALPADLERFLSELPLCNDYQKLNERYKDNLKGAKTVIPR